MPLKNRIPTADTAIRIANGSSAATTATRSCARKATPARSQNRPTPASVCAPARGYRPRFGARQYHKSALFKRLPDPGTLTCPSTKEVQTGMLIALLILLLAIAIFGGVFVTKFLFFVLLFCVLLAIIGFFARRTA